MLPRLKLADWLLVFLPLSLSSLIHLSRLTWIQQQHVDTVINDSNDRLSPSCWSMGDNGLFDWVGSMQVKCCHWIYQLGCCFGAQCKYAMVVSNVHITSSFQVMFAAGSKSEYNMWRKKYLRQSTCQSSHAAADQPYLQAHVSNLKMYWSCRLISVATLSLTTLYALMILLIQHDNKKVNSITVDDITGWCIL